MITDFNKHREEKLKVVESEVKQLARNFKSLATRVEQSINKIKKKAASHSSILSHNHQEEHKDKKHVHFRQEVQIVEAEDPLQSKRLWNDSKNRKDKLDRGQFTEGEV